MFMTTIFYETIFVISAVIDHYLSHYFAKMVLSAGKPITQNDVLSVVNALILNTIIDKCLTGYRLCLQL